MERKEYILNLINFNTMLDNLRTNINLICYRLTNFEMLPINEKLDFQKLEKNLNEIIKDFEPPKDDKKKEKEVKENENQKDK